MRLVSTAVTCLSISAFSQAVDAQVSRDSERTKATALEEIVVTAQKREERLEDVPISISVVGGEALEKSSDRGVIDAVSRVPGVFATVTSNGGRFGANSSIAIRGVSAATVGANTVAYYLDNVPFSRTTNAVVPDSSPYDIDRVEVLRGPQGTLYGSSALNGVVRILTKNPNFQDFEFKTRASLSNTDHGSESYSGDVAFNAPIIENKLAARVVLGYQELGGWIDNPALSKEDANDSERTTARLKLAAKPTDNFSVGVSAWISRTDNGGLPFSNDGGQTTPATAAEPSTVDYDNFSLDLRYDFSAFSISSASSYLDYTLDNVFDFGGASMPFPPGTRQIANSGSNVFTEELLLSSTGDGSWRWTFGSMYRNAQDNTNVSISIFPVRSLYYYESKSMAVFGELTYAFADGQFEVTGGLRYFRDEASRWEVSRAPFGFPPGQGPLSFEKTFKRTTPRVVLTWHPSDDATLYASYSKGFRSGLFQEFNILQAFPDTPPAKPDTLTNYEIGAKAGFGRFTFETAVYYIDWKDVQQDSSTLIPLLGYAPSFTNGEGLSGIGVDLAMLYAPIDSLTLGLNVGWNDLTFDEDVFNRPGDEVTPELAMYEKGDRRSNSPEFTAGASIDYTIALGSGGYRGRLSASGNYIDQQTTGARTDYIPGSTTIRAGYTQFKADSLLLARASASIEAPTHWSATLFIDNATNEEGIQPDPFSTTGQSNTVLRPRTYGVQFEYRY